ncbi:MAG: rane fusion protein multidrug efflux system [Campylobacterota bacterium]|nr:rane fusion protein multidrug efflux system [Campylobacterota bacterium]
MKIVFFLLFVLVYGLNAQGIYASFYVQADKNANLAFDASGIVKRVFVDISSSVKKGDKLVELVNDETKASLEIAKAELASAEVIYKYAQRDYNRWEKIGDIVDEAKLDVYALAYEKAKTLLNEAKASVAYQEELYSKTFLYAPFDGAIYEKNVEAGDVVNAMNLKTILKIQSINKRKLIIEFDQKYWKQVKVGQSFLYKIDGDTVQHRANIVKIYPSINQESRKIRAEVEAKDFLVGLFGDGYIQTEVKE